VPGNRRARGFYTATDPATGEKKVRPITGKAAKPRRKVVDWATYRSAAEVAELSRYVASSSAGRQKVHLSPGSEGFSCAPDRKRKRYTVHAPNWIEWTVPVDGFSKWRLYRNSLWHEGRHAADTPDNLFTNFPKMKGVPQNVLRILVNIVEDRRIEDRGVKHHPGMIPERKHKQSYAFALRPHMEVYRANPKGQLVEAFLQRLLIGHVKGEMNEPQMRLWVEQAAEYVEKQLQRMMDAPEKDPELTKKIEEVVKTAARKLHLDDPDVSGEEAALKTIQKIVGEDEWERMVQEGAEALENGDTDKYEKIQAEAQKALKKGLEQRRKEQEEELKRKGLDPDKWDADVDPTDLDEHWRRELEEQEKKGEEVPVIDVDDTWKTAPAEADPEDAKKAMENFYKLEKRQAEAEGRKERRDGDPAGETYASDVDEARDGNAESRAEYLRITGRVKEDKVEGVEDFAPIIEPGDPAPYVDQGFRKQMNQRLKEWRRGRTVEYTDRGGRLNVRSYIRTHGEKPFKRVRRRSVKGEKYLFVLDFSGSMSLREEDYKRALVNTFEALDGIGAKTAVFAFGTAKLAGSAALGRFKVKTFEQGRWNPADTGKLVALEAGGGTPTASVLRGLKRYIRRHRPQYVITVTDGEPDNEKATEAAIKELKKASRNTKVVGFGLPSDPRYKEPMEESFKKQGYDDYFTADDVKEIPEKLVGMIAPA